MKNLFMKKFYITNQASWLFSIFAIFSLYPYLLWNNSYIYKLTFFLVLITTLITISNRGIYKENLKCFLLILTWVIYALVPREIDNINFFSTGILSILIFSLLPDDNKIIIFEKFKTLLCIILALSIIEYPLIILGIVSSIGNIEPFSEIKITRGQFYINYIFNIVLNDQHLSLGGFSFFRFSSIFDEPGLIGSICAILFFTYPESKNKNKNKNKNNIERIILLISIIISFSLGGYLLFIIGCFINFALGKGENKTKKLLLLISISILGLASLSSTEGGRTYITDRIWNDNNITLGENNRVDNNFDKIYYNIYNSPSDLLIGNGKDAHTRTGFDVSSYKGFLYNYGLIGALLIITVLSYIIIIKKASLEAYVILVLLLVNSFQRPIEFNFYYYFIFLSTICYYVKKNKPN